MPATLAIDDYKLISVEPSITEATNHRATTHHQMVCNGKYVCMPFG